MSHWNKIQLENMLEDVVNELDLSDDMFEKHGPLGTPPAELVRIVLDQKDMQIKVVNRSYANLRRKLNHLMATTKEQGK